MDGGHAGEDAATARRDVSYACRRNAAPTTSSPPAHLRRRRSGDNPDYAGAKIFQQRCSGCHTLKAAGTEGSAVNANNREYKDGPNFNQRKETKDGVIYAIENGGFSSGPMPQDIVVNGDAQKVADFVAKYSGKEVSTVPTPEGSPQASTPSG